MNRLKASAAAIMLAGVVLATAQPALVGVSRTEATFSCDSAPKGECQFVLYASNCTEAAIVNGKPSLACNLSYLQEFTLKVGESKRVEDLPKGFKQCPVVSGAPAVFPACAK